MKLFDTEKINIALYFVNLEYGGLNKIEEKIKRSKAKVTDSEVFYNFLYQSEKMNEIKNQGNSLYFL